jgi:hypothetical protein
MRAVQDNDGADTPVTRDNVFCDKNQQIVDGDARG